MLSSLVCSVLALAAGVSAATHSSAPPVNTDTSGTPLFEVYPMGQCRGDPIGNYSAWQCHTVTGQSFRVHGLDYNLDGGYMVVYPVVGCHSQMAGSAISDQRCIGQGNFKSFKAHGFNNLYL